MAKEGKKKHHVGLIILITFLTVFLVIPVAFVFIFIFDTSTKDISNVQSKDFTTLTNEMMGKAFETTGDDGKISMKITEDDINSLVVSVPEKMGLTNYIPKVYCEVEDTNYRFYFDLQASFFKTRVCLDTTVDVTAVEGVDSVVFGINKISIGRASHLTGILKWFASTTNLINDSMIENLFNINGTKLNIKSDLANNRIYYPVTDFKKDIDSLISKSITSENMFMTIITQLFNNDNVFKADFHNGIGINFDLNGLGELPEEIKPTHSLYNKDLKAALKKYRNAIQIALNEGLLDADSTTDCPNVFKCLLRGSENVSTDIQNWIKGKTELVNRFKQTDIGIDLSSHAGHLGTVIKDINSQFTAESFHKPTQEEITAIIGEAKTPIKLLSLTDEMMSNYAKSLDLIGYSTFINKKINDSYSTNFLGLDNFNFRFLKNSDNKDAIYVYSGLNINGFEVPITVKAVSSGMEESTKSSKFIIQDILLGNTSLGTSGDLVNVLLDLISKGEGEQTGEFYFDKSNKAFVISFNNIYAKAPTEITTVLTQYSDLIKLDLQADVEGNLNLFIVRK